MSDSITSNRNILIVDDHPITVDGYKTLLTNIKSNANAEFYVAYNCEVAHYILNLAKSRNDKLHFAFLDINLPPFEEKKIYSGCDLAVIIKAFFPECKIIILTMHKEPVMVNTIIKSINPNGFIAKSDINYKNFPEIFQCIENSDIFYSVAIKEAVKKMIRKNISWDEMDSKILQLLSEGIKTIDLPKYIPLSLSAIEKRKSNLKRQMVLHSISDKELIDEAKKLGLI